ncbi:putative spindle pole body associated protein SnaD, partial [Aspergillus homomorphus CBS 101889]
DTTTHDTVGASTLATPLFMPSSPPSRRHNAQSYSPLSAKSPRTIDRGATMTHGEEARSPLKQSYSPRSSRASSLERAANDIDARLAQYTVDFSQFPSTQALDEDADPLAEFKFPHEENLSDVGGPDDFTANLEKYLMGDGDTMEDKHFMDFRGDAHSLPELEPLFDDDDLEEQGHDLHHSEEEDHDSQPPLPESPAQPRGHSRHNSQQMQQQQQQQQQQRQQNSQSHQPAVEDEPEPEPEPELGEYSEFGPPIDMSTPSQFLRRASGFNRDITHLENIEEDPDDEMEATTTTPSVRRHKTPSPRKGDQGATGDLRKQIFDLQNALQERDEQLEKGRRRVLEAASAGQQIKHLQAELQRKSSLLDELYANRTDETILREKIHLLQKHNEERETFLHKSTINASELNALQKQISDMQKELQTRGSSHPDLDAERLDTIAYLRQQLNLAQEQLQKRDATLDETIAKLKDVTTAKEQQLREKNTEIDELKAQISKHLLEVEKLENELDTVNQAYTTLEERIIILETKNRPLEEKNSSLEADLTRAQSQVTAQENALKAMAADLPLETGGNTYSEILELIKDLGQPSQGTHNSNTRPSAKDQERPVQDQDQNQNQPAHEELKRLQDELSKVQSELTQANSAKKTLELQLSRSEDQAVEAQTLIHSIETESTRLSKRADDLRSNLTKTQQELTQVKEERTKALETIERLHKEQQQQQDGKKQTRQQQLQNQQPSPPPSPPVPHQQQPHQHQHQQLQTQVQAQRQKEREILEQTQSLQSELRTLRAAHATEVSKLRDLLSGTEHRESRYKTQVTSLLSQRERHQSENRALRARVEHLESVVAAKEETAAAVDERIARSVEKREKEWQRRVELLLKERERMGRALMWSWGEKEVGGAGGDSGKENLAVVGQDEKGRRKQGYRYKYA